MQADPDTLRYHGRRSIDELIGAVNADTIAVALVHKRLSLLHLDRLVSAITAAADAIHPRPSRQSATMPAEADQRPAL